MGTVLHAQNVTIINNYDSRDEQYDDEDLVLKNVTKHTYIINEYEPANIGEQRQVEEMISYGLRSHIDNVYRSVDGTVIAVESDGQFNEAATAIVQNALWIHDENFSTFPGFSEKIESMAAELRNLNGYKTQFGDDDLREPQNGKVGLYIFQRMVYDLKKACEEEVAAYLNENFEREPDKPASDSDSPILEAGDYNLERNDQNEQRLADIKLNPEDLFEEDKKKKKKKRRKDEQTLFNERIVQLLEENNRILSNYNTRFEDLQNQIDEIREGGGGNEDIREEIAELRGMIIDLANGREIRESDGSRTRLVNKEMVTVYYERNQHQLTASQRMRLNGVKQTLSENPDYTAVITGYADKTGSAAMNAWISEKRATAVRDYLLSQGVPKSRLIINYLGDEESLSPNPADRKVEVQYLLNYTVEE
jgi:outer membrane protein OmpA-like peptidoglycan-associated protein